MNKLFYIIGLFILLSGCASPKIPTSSIYEESSLKIILAQPAENSIIYYNDSIYITINYSIGNYNKSLQYFADAELLFNNSSFLINGARKTIQNNTGIITLTLQPSILYVSEENEYTIYSPYTFLITLNRNYKINNFITIANQTLNYNGQK
jgi:hypothetical protein